MGKCVPLEPPAPQCQVDEDCGDCKECAQRPFRSKECGSQVIYCRKKTCPDAPTCTPCEQLVETGIDACKCTKYKCIPHPPVGQCGEGCEDECEECVTKHLPNCNKKIPLKTCESIKCKNVSPPKCGRCKIANRLERSCGCIDYDGCSRIEGEDQCDDETPCADPDGLLPDDCFKCQKEVICVPDPNDYRHYDDDDYDYSYLYENITARKCKKVDPRPHPEQCNECDHLVEVGKDGCENPIKHCTRRTCKKPGAKQCSKQCNEPVTERDNCGCDISVCRPKKSKPKPTQPPQCKQECEICHQCSWVKDVCNQWKPGCERISCPFVNLTRTLPDICYDVVEQDSCGCETGLKPVPAIVLSEGDCPKDTHISCTRSDVCGNIQPACCPCNRTCDNKCKEPHIIPDKNKEGECPTTVCKRKACEKKPPTCNKCQRKVITEDNCLCQEITCRQKDCVADKACPSPGELYRYTDDCGCERIRCRVPPTPTPPTPYPTATGSSSTPIEPTGPTGPTGPTKPTPPLPTTTACPPEECKKWE